MRRSLSPPGTALWSASSWPTWPCVPPPHPGSSLPDSQGRTEYKARQPPARVWPGGGPTDKAFNTVYARPLDHAAPAGLPGQALAQRALAAVSGSVLLVSPRPDAPVPSAAGLYPRTRGPASCR